MSTEHVGFRHTVCLADDLWSQTCAVLTALSPPSGLQLQQELLASVWHTTVHSTWLNSVRA